MDTLSILAERHRQLGQLISEGATLVRDLRDRHEEMEKYLRVPKALTVTEKH